MYYGLGYNDDQLLFDGGDWGGTDFWGGGESYATIPGYPGIVPPGAGGWTPWIQTGINIINRTIGGGGMPGGISSPACGPEPACDNPPCWDRLKADVLPRVVSKVRASGVPDVVFWYGDLLLVDGNGCFTRVGRAGSVDQARALAAQLGQSTCLSFENQIYCPEGTRPAPAVPPVGALPPAGTTPPIFPGLPPVTVPPGGYPSYAVTQTTNWMPWLLLGGAALLLWKK